MFQGETAITIDDKGRMAVPTAYRDLIARECDGRLVFTYNPFESGSLYLYSTTQQIHWAMITPIGGILLIVGWTALAIVLLRRPSEPVA